MTPSEPRPLLTEDFFHACTESQLREYTLEDERRFIRGGGDVDLLTMSNNLSANDWQRYVALCRALRAKGKPDGQRSEKPPQG